MKDCMALVVEDEESVRHLLELLVRRHCSEVHVASDGEEAMRMLRERSYALVVLDLMLPRMNGLAVSEAIAALASPPKVIVLSALSRYFADRFPPDTVVLQKPFDIDRIEDALTAFGFP
ncbi:MAG TPA: response regulator [Thermoanaerobaculia bacterium]|jgi:DNA-binding response OmpR family regulator|nr:response regulator [Thermoanaerobaculia bacterium]